MPLPKFALLTFNVIPREYDAVAQNMPPSIGLDGKYGWVREIVESIPDNCVHPDTGVFVFKTKECWGIINAITRKLIELRTPITLVLFDGDLIGDYQPQALRQLHKLGVQVHQLGFPQSSLE